MADASHRSTACIGILLSLIAACGGSDGTAPASTTVDSAGIRIVTSGRSALGDDGLTIDTTPLLRIGAEEAGPYQFSFVMSGLLLDGGGIAVAELSANEVRLFDSSGHHVRTVGRSGRGPGEFQTITGLFRRSADSLAAFDQGQRRTTIFAIAGGVPRVVLSQVVPRTRGHFDALGAFGDGRLALYNPGGGFRPDLAPGLQWDTTDVVILDPADGAGRTIARLPSRQQFVLPGGDTKVLTPAHTAIRAASADGFYWATSDRYEIRFVDTAGVIRRILRRPVEAHAVEPRMVETWIASNLDEVRRREGEDAIARYRLRYDGAAIGDRVPLFERAFVDDRGQLWVGSSEWPALDANPRRWSIFAANGSWLGDLMTPPQLRILDSRDGVVLGVWQEEGEAPRVQVHRLRQQDARQ